MQHQEKARRMEEEILYGSKPVTHGPKRFAGNTPTKTPNSKIRKVCCVHYICFDICCVPKMTHFSCSIRGCSLGIQWDHSLGAGQNWFTLQSSAFTVVTVAMNFGLHYQCTLGTNSMHNFLLAHRSYVVHRLRALHITPDKLCCLPVANLHVSEKNWFRFLWILEVPKVCHFLRHNILTRCVNWPKHKMKPFDMAFKPVDCCYSWYNYSPSIINVWITTGNSCDFIDYVVPSVLLTLSLGSRKGIRPVKNWVMRYWHGYLPGARCKWFAYCPADATATPSSLTPVKFRMVCLSGDGLPRLSWKKGR